MDFKSHNDIDVFQKHVRFERRYVHTEPVIEFLEALRGTLLDRTRTLSKGAILWRSQIGFAEVDLEGETMITGFNTERMKPNREFCGEGRANPRAYRICACQLIPIRVLLSLDLNGRKCFL